MKKLSKGAFDPATLVSALLANVIRRFNLEVTNTAISAMGEWYVRLENSEFIVCVSADRGGSPFFIEVGSKIRRKPRAQMRGPWSLCHLRGFLDDMKDHYLFQSLEEQASWLEQHAGKLFDSSLLNSEELNSWAVKASRRMFGQDPKN